MNSRYFKHTWHLRWYLILFISLIIVFSSLVLLFIPAILYKKQYFEQAQNYCKNMIVQTSTGVHAALQQFDETTDKLIEDDRFTELFNLESDNATRTYQYQNILREYFPPTNIPGYYIKGIDLYIKDPFFSHLQYGAQTLELNLPFASTYYTSALRAPLSLNWNDYISKDTLTISRIIYDLDSYIVRGLMVISISKDFLLDKFNTYNTMEIENFFIIDGEGVILCSDNAALLGTVYPEYPESFVDAIGVTESPEQITVYCKSNQVTYQYPYQNWNVIININKHILLQDFNTILRLFYFITIFIVLAGIWIAVKFSLYISKPIQELTKKMTEIQNGNLEANIGQKTAIHEISLMNEGFNSMVQRLNNLINTVYRIELAQKEAQFHALQAQINPHFLFNTMQLINWKANEYEAYPVCDMVQSLCYMLETTLSYKDEHTFSLREELEYLHHYAQIIHYKYLDRIVLKFNISPELLDCQIPILTFQPFIENSIVHGLEPSQDKGIVTLTITKQNNNLVASIKDNGVGIRPDLLRKLQKNLPINSSTKKSSYHIALHNVQMRIKLLYGEQYGYTIDSHLHQGTLVTLTIPFKTTKEASLNDQTINC